MFCLFGVSVLMLEYYYEVFLIKYNFGVFDEMSIMEFLMKYKVLIMEFLMKYKVLIMELVIK